MAKQTDPRLLQAMQSIAAGQSKQAEELCRAALGERKRDDLAMALLAQACNASGKYDEALQLIRSAIAKNNKRADYHGLLADILTTRGDFRGALGAYDKALKLQPNHQGVIAGKANTWLRLNEPEKAKKLVEPLVKKRWRRSYDFNCVCKSTHGRWPSTRCSGSVASSITRKK